MKKKKLWQNLVLTGIINKNTLKINFKECSNLCLFFHDEVII